MQTYASCIASVQQTATSHLISCVANIETWLSSNRLKLNANKTEFIWLGTRQQLAKLNSEPLQLKGELIMPLKKVCDLSVVIAVKLNIDAHARNVIRSCFYQLQQLRTIRSSLPMDTKCTVAIAFIATRVDYCNGVMYSMLAQVIRRLNAAARLVVGAGKFQHITQFFVMCFIGCQCASGSFTRWP